MKRKHHNLYKRLSYILIESFFIVIALLLALALDQWSVEQKELELANSIKRAIYAELSDNKRILEESRASHKEILNTINEYISNQTAKEENELDLDFGYSMVLISNSAWNSAQITQAIQSFSFNEITNYSQIYQIQELYLHHQAQMIDKILQMGEINADETLGFSKGLAYRLKILIDMNKNICDGISSTL